ncbi:hypothetical protein BT69DRAFT_1284793 [Atractiella rhizophila]|nr:hypothetical protein BT69DRAFT_1284793 [Atractiella rhizophila]
MLSELLTRTLSIQTESLVSLIITIAIAFFLIYALLLSIYHTIRSTFLLAKFVFKWTLVALIFAVVLGEMGGWSGWRFGGGKVECDVDGAGGGVANGHVGVGGTEGWKNPWTTHQGERSNPYSSQAHSQFHARSPGHQGEEEQPNPLDLLLQFMNPDSTDATPTCDPKDSSCLKQQEKLRKNKEGMNGAGSVGMMVMKQGMRYFTAPLSELLGGWRTKIEEALREEIEKEEERRGTRNRK